MSVQSRIARLETQRPDAGESKQDLWRERWLAAYKEIAATMDAREFSEVQAEIMSFIKRVNSGELNYWSHASVLSFVACRVFSLVHRTANGFQVGLLMPPALAQAWRDLDEKLADASSDERHKGSFNSQECADCAAEHPWLGRYELSEAQRINVIANPSELIKTCLVCGGEVKQWVGQRHMARRDIDTSPLSH
jgi:hypothetical protein